MGRARNDSVTLRDVARQAGVSTATVSRVLNNRAYVAASMRDKVLDAAFDLGYSPNPAARALASQRSFTMGALVPTIENPSFSATVEALQVRLADNGYMLFQAGYNYDLEREFAQARTLATRGIDGLMLIGSRHDSALYDYLRSHRIPFVNTWVLDPKRSVPSVGFDNRKAATQIANFLMDLGHTEIGVIAGLTKNNDRAAERLEGLREALKARGLTLKRERLLERPYRISEGRYAMRALMEQGDPPTAIMCSNDMVAFGALSEATRMGIGVPDDLSIVGFDDAEFAQELNPPLTTMRVQVVEIGTLAAEYLIDRVEGRQGPERIEVPVNMIVRQSTAPPRRRS